MNSLIWLEGHLVEGHGVASGRRHSSPYPAGTIALQQPHFRQWGLDLSPYFPGTLNLDFSPGEWRLQQPHWYLPQVCWIEDVPPETFSFWHCRLRLLTHRGPRCSSSSSASASAPASATASDPEALEVQALIYHPDPQTKPAHHQPPSVLEVLAPPLQPWIENARQQHRNPGIQLGVDPRRCRLIQPARLRSRLLEALKFRVLAAQESFFEFAACSRDGSVDDLAGFRCWLLEAWPEALDLSDADLRRTLADAHRLYVN